MIITKKHLDRRTFLRGAGAAIGLPLLDAMSPALAAPARSRANGAVRLAVLYVPNGIVMKDWTPEYEGPLEKLPAIVEPLESFRSEITLVSGLAQNCGRALGDGPGDHARAAASYLTGVHPRKTAGADIKNGISFDQIAAQHVGTQTRFPSLELGLEKTGIVGNCDSGYSCAYTNNLAWRNDTAPLPPEANPRLVFERLFGVSEGPMDPASREKRKLYSKSILDLVRDDTQRLRAGLGQTDQRKLDEYVYSIREIEKRIESSESAAVDPGIGKPDGIPVDYAEHANLMFDLMLAAFRADLTRVITVMMGREGSNRTYREIGVSDAHHGLTHHKGDPEKIEKIARINRYHVERLAAFLTRLRATEDGDANLLQRSAVLYGGGISDGNRHDHHDLPTLIAGGANGGFKMGRHVRYPQETPCTNLFLSILHRMGVPAESVGDSSGKLELAGVA